METNFFPGQEKLRGYWNRPGGKFGVIAGIGILAAIGYYVVPIMTKIVWNTVNFGIALAVAGILLYCLTHRTLRLSLFYFYEWLMRKLVGVIIQLDPFIIAEDYIKDMEEQRETLYKQTTEVEGQKEKIILKISEKERELTKLMSTAQVAKEKNMMPELGNATRQIGRINEYIKQLSPIRDNLARIGDYLTGIHKNSKYLIEDARNELELKKDLYRSVTSGNKALTSAMKIFKGDPEKKLLVEQSMEYLKDDIANKLANMKKAISYSADFMRSIDLDNATFEKDGLRMLEQYGNADNFKLEGHKAGAAPNTGTGSFNDLLT